MGFDNMVGGGQGGAFSDSREACEIGLKSWLGSTCISFGLLLVFLGCLELLGAMLRNATSCSLSQGKPI